MARPVFSISHVLTLKPLLVSIHTNITTPPCSCSIYDMFKMFLWTGFAYASTLICPSPASQGSCYDGRWRHCVNLPDPKRQIKVLQSCVLLIIFFPLTNGSICFPKSDMFKLLALLNFLLSETNFSAAGVKKKKNEENIFAISLYREHLEIISACVRGQACVPN